VTAIRNAGASSQMILLTGANYASAGQFVSSGSAAALIKITSLDGSFDGLILDLHKYLDVDNSGTHST
jgi:endoglucanase